MNKKSSFFLIVSFIAVQALAFLHMAHYGVNEHTHDGHICEIYLHGEQVKYSAPAAIIDFHGHAYDIFTLALPRPLFNHFENYRIASPRAPPASLLNLTV